MPRANIKNRRALVAYHLYNQGSKRGRSAPRQVFIDREDKRQFLALLARHLGVRPALNSRGEPYSHMRGLIVLLAYCVMTTHFHLLVWQRDPRGIAELMNRVKAEYVRYFNKKYGNTKPLFNGPVQAKPVRSRAYFRWLVGYVHSNHNDDPSYEFASHAAWIDDHRRPGWIDPLPALDVFGGLNGYLAYLDSFAAKRSLDADLGHRRARRST